MTLLYGVQALMLSANKRQLSIRWVLLGTVGTFLAGGPAQLALAQATNAPPQFQHTCSLCHGADAKGTDRAPTMVGSASLRSMSDSDIASVIQKGKGRMPAFPMPAADV